MLVKLAWRNLWRNKLRTVIVLASMVFGLTGVTLMIGFMNAMSDNMISNTINWQTSHLQIHQQSYPDSPKIEKTLIDQKSLAEFLDNNNKIKIWTSRFLLSAMVTSARGTRPVIVNGINLQQERQLRPFTEHISAGDYLQEKGKNQILVSQKIAKRLKLRVGSKVVITFSSEDGEIIGAAFRVFGLFKTPSSTFDEQNLFVSKADLKKLTDISGDHEIALLLKDIKQLAQLKEEIKKHSSADNSVRDWMEIQPLLATMIASMDSMNWIMLIIFVGAMGFAIVNILLMSVFERTREFGVLMAVGMHKKQLLNLILLESTMLGLTGATLGLLLSSLVLFIMQFTGISLTAMAEGLNALGIETLLYPQVSIDDYIFIFIAVVVVSLLAGLYPAKQILKKSPASAMSEKL